MTQQCIYRHNGTDWSLTSNPSTWMPEVCLSEDIIVQPSGLFITRHERPPLRYTYVYHQTWASTPEVHLCLSPAMSVHPWGRPMFPPDMSVHPWGRPMFITSHERPPLRYTYVYHQTGASTPEVDLCLSTDIQLHPWSLFIPRHLNVQLWTCLTFQTMKSAGPWR